MWEAFFAGKVKQPQQFLLGLNVVAYERKKLEKNATQELNKDSFNHNKCVNKGMLGYIRKNSKQKRHPTISWTPFYNYKSLIESLCNSNYNAIEIL